MAATGVYDKAIGKNTLTTIRSFFCENASLPVRKSNTDPCEYVHKCEHMKACQISRGVKFGEKHMAATGV